MTIDEAIKHTEEVAKKQENNAKNYPRPNKSVKGSGRRYNAYLKCAEEHRQLAEWLKDYKRLLEQEPYEDCISRSSIKQKLQEHHDFFVKAYGGFSNLPQNDKSRVDEITSCIAMVVNEPSVTPAEKPNKSEIPTSCSTCILDNTDACTRGAGRAVDDEACEDYLASPTGAEGSEE